MVEVKQVYGETREAAEKAAKEWWATHPDCKQALQPALMQAGAAWVISIYFTKPTG